MTLNEEECSQKWSSLSEKLSKLDTLIDDLTKTHKNASLTHPKNLDMVKLHLSAAFAMTELEKLKLRFTLTCSELKDHSIQIEEDRVANYVKKVKKAERSSEGYDEKRPFRIDAEVSKRTIVHYTE